MAFDIQAWSDYGVAVVGGAAALTGLLFVAVSVNSAWFSSSEAHRGRAGQALVLFVVPLVTGLLLLIPGQTTTSLGVEIAAFGLLVGRVLLMLGSAKLKDEPRAIVVIDRLSPRAIITTALIACGASLVVGHFGGLYWRYAPVVQLSETPAVVTGYSELGEYTRAILADLGYDEEQMARLHDDKVVTWPADEPELVGAR